MARILASIAVAAAFSLPVVSEAGDVPRGMDLAQLLALPQSEMRPVIERFEADYGALRRAFPVDHGAGRVERLSRFLAEWLTAVEAIDYDRLSAEAAIDWQLLRTRVRRIAAQMELDESQFADAKPLVPFFDTATALAATREEMPPPPPAASAETLAALAKAVDEAEKGLRAKLAKPAEDPDRPGPGRCRIAYRAVESLRGDLRAWFSFRDGYDPLFSWWMKVPYESANAALERLSRTLREQGMGQTAEKPETIVGTPIGRDALLEALAFEWIPYSPEELLAIADREMAWCQAELCKAAGEMGIADWKEALERIKRDHVEPGEQPALIKALAEESIAFLRQHDLVTVPPEAEETWRFEMMSPERQLVTPFFTGGEVISVSFPTSGMRHEDKEMSLRGNNRSFAHATVHHELIPGHHLQGWSEARYQTQRDPFGTPFWTEGWALHWEMLLWDRGFGRTPEERIGMLWWRAHRAARIQFSLRFQLGEWTPEQCVDYLVDTLGHERANAEGEVRRSVSGDYAPLYQIAYMIGGLQFRALRHELVDGGMMTDRAFHDRVLRENNMPVELVRAILRGERLPKDARPSWRFDDAFQPGAKQ